MSMGGHVRPSPRQTPEGPFTPPSPSDPLCMSGGPVSGHYALFEAIRYKRHRQAMLLAEAGIDVNCRNERGMTPLVYAVVAVDEEKSRLKLVKLFLEAGCDPNASDWQGLTALMHASISGQAETVKPLLDCVWTNPCLTDSNGNTALMHAASYGHHEVIAVFISVFRNNIKGLQLHKRNNEGLTALHLAVRNRNDLCARLLTREAQFFPNAIEEFPDPKDLDREPTPIQECLNFNKKSGLFKFPFAPQRVARSSGEEMHSIGTMTLELSSDSSMPISYRLKELECNMEDDCHVPYPYQSHHTKSTQVTSVARQNTPDDVIKTASKIADDICEESIQSVTANQTTPEQIPSVTGKSNAAQKILEPLTPIENMTTNGNVTNGFQRRCLLKQSSSRITSGLRMTHEPREIGFKYSRASSEDSSFISGTSIRSLQKVKGARQDSMPSILPVIPCGKETAPLPPVRYAMRRSSSKKDSLCFPSATFITVRADQSPRDIDMFKKNVVALS